MPLISKRILLADGFPLPYNSIDQSMSCIFRQPKLESSDQDRDCEKIPKLIEPINQLLDLFVDLWKEKIDFLVGMHLGRATLGGLMKFNLSDEIAEPEDLVSPVAAGAPLSMASCLSIVAERLHVPLVVSQKFFESTLAVLPSSKLDALFIASRPLGKFILPYAPQPLIVYELYSSSKGWSEFTSTRPSIEEMDDIISLFQKGRFSKALQRISHALSYFPSSEFLEFYRDACSCYMRCDLPSDWAGEIKIDIRGEIVPFINAHPTSISQSDRDKDALIAHLKKEVAHLRATQLVKPVHKKTKYNVQYVPNVGYIQETVIDSDDDDDDDIIDETKMVDDDSLVEHDETNMVDDDDSLVEDHDGLSSIRLASTSKVVSQTIGDPSPSSSPSSLPSQLPLTSSVPLTSSPVLSFHEDDDEEDDDDVFALSETLLSKNKLSQSSFYAWRHFYLYETTLNDIIAETPYPLGESFALMSIPSSPSKSLPSSSSSKSASSPSSKS
eukprot:CAMPEP_0117427132 /NCGR_PEP_ID=MMETSP0758-20121206/7058_1 /TAXON_ID=63605 /ORGANISM="Percolomonas cosmopolitus, Strain AE-1 (ATCC 50343)" /LENGTH=497 /DNA_ID=CAMNT_0005212619 /DNA_START=1066 /DNA_END=2555 /DNA_ORIENTATION=+